MRNGKMVVSTFLQVLLVVCMLASVGEAATWSLKNSTVNSTTSATIDDATPYTGLYSLKVDGAERMWQQWFWYRLGPDGFESALDTLTKTSASKPTATSLSLTYTLASQFDITILYELTPYSLGLGKANIKKTVTIKNISSTELDYHLFEYADFDLTDLATQDDNVEIVKNRFYQNGTQSDGSGVTLVHESSLAPNQYDLDSAQAYISPELKDDTTTNFGLSVLETPYRYGDDMQFGSQWDLKIPVGQSLTFTITDNIYPTLPVPVTQTVNGGQCVSYGGQADISVSLTGTADNLTNLNIVNILPKDTLFLSATDGGILDSASNSVSWTLPSLSAGTGALTRQASITVNSTTDIVNKVLVVSDQAFPTRLPDPLLEAIPVFPLCNHPPSITSAAITSVNIESPYVYAVKGADVDAGTTLSYVLDVAPAGMAINPSTGFITWNPSKDNAGSYPVTVRVSDGSLSGTQSFVLKVVSVPLFTSAPVIYATLNQSYTYAVVALNPIPNGTVYYSLASGPPDLSVGYATGIITWTPTVAGVYPISIKAKDGSGENYQIFSINITLTPNASPVFTSTPATIATVGSVYTYNVIATDADNDPLSYSLTTFPSGMLISAGVVTWTPTTTQSASMQNVTVQVSDSKGGIATQSFGITVGAAAKLPQSIGTISFMPATLPVNGITTAIATATSGLALTFKTLTPAICTVSGATVSGITAGTCTIAANQAGNTAYEAAVQVTQNITVTKAAATVILSNLSQIYDGTGKVATATTNPAGLAVAITYAGSATAPSAVGTYAVVATINDTNYSGSATGTMTIANANATVTLSGLNQTYDGTAKATTATTNPTGLAVSISYAGSTTAPTAAGSYAVVATINDANYSGSATGTLVIAKASATVTLGVLSQSYDGTAKAASATTNPTGKTVTFTYNGSTTTPTAAGSYTVVGTINDTNFSGSATGTLTIAKATPAISWSTPTAVYVGAILSSSQLNATASTPGSFIYNPAVGTVMDIAGNQTLSTVFTPTDVANYNGATASVTLAVNNKQNPTLTWNNPVAITYGTALSATQLNATVSGVIAGTYTYTPVLGTKLDAGDQTLSVTFTPSDTTTYNTVTKTVSLTVNKAATTVNLSGLSATYDGTAKAATAATNPAGLAVAIAITYAGSITAPTAAGSYAVVATVSDSNYTGSATGTLVISKATPAITWATPAPVYVGTALSATQLNAIVSTAGSFVYIPADGTTINSAGPQNLSVAFTPTDTINYNNASASVILTVNSKITPSVIWAAPAAISYGTVLGSNQLNASAGSIAGSFSYSPPAGTTLNAGSQILTATFTPSDTNTYNIATKTVTLTVNKDSAGVSLSGLSATYDGSPKAASATTIPSGLSVELTYDGSSSAPTSAGTYAVAATITDANYTGSANGSLTITKATPAITWSTPSAVYVGTVLSSTQMNASASVAGSFTYTPASGTALNTAGSQTLSASFIPSDTANYNGATATVTLAVNSKQNPTITWNNPIAITYGTLLSATQLNATVSGGIAGTYTYTPILGTKLNAGNQTLSVTFTPTDVVTYNTTTKSVTLAVTKASATVALSNLSQTYNGSARSATVSTTPAGLSTITTYAGSTTAPTASGIYAVVATISDSNYSGSASGSLTIAKATPAITWSTPSAVYIGTALSSSQLDATASTAGSFVYSPASGTTLTSAGAQTLSAAFTPSDTANYNIATATVTLTVNDNSTTNQPPVITSSPVTVAYEKGYFYYQVAASDPNGEVVKFSLSIKPSGMNINSKTGVISWRPSDSGTYSVIVKASDPAGLYSTQSFKVTVLNHIPNNPPKIASEPVLSVTAGMLYTYDVNATDPDGDALFYRLITAPAGMSIDDSTGLITWIPFSSQAGVKKVVVEAVDIKGGKVAQSFNISVLIATVPMNNPPTIITTPVASAIKGSVYSYDLQASDPDGDAIVYSLVSKPYGMTINSSTGNITWKPSTTGSYKVSVNATDNKGAYTTQSYTLTVGSAFSGSNAWEKGAFRN